MGFKIVLTLTGTDRVGLVDEVTQRLLKLGGNIETSQMARLGGEFAMLMMVALPSDQNTGLDQAFAELTSRGYKLTVTPTQPIQAQAHIGWSPYRIKVEGADHEGIIHEIAHSLSQNGINIETMDTGTAFAPISGSPLFTMDALVLVPPSLALSKWQGELDTVGHHLQVDIKVSAS